MKDDIKNALLELIDERGLLMPERVVAAARDATSPLHTHFTWDDDSAAQKWRMQQARMLINSVEIIIDQRAPVSVNAFISLPTDRTAGGGYRTVETVLDNDFMRAQLIEDIRKHIEKWETRAAEIGMVINLAPLKKVIAHKRASRRSDLRASA